jgi:hypothetical protein
MPKVSEKTISRLHLSSKLHKYLREQPQADVSLKDIQQSLSNIGISLSKRVIEDREKR